MGFLKKFHPFQVTASIKRSLFLREAAQNTTLFAWRSFEDDLIRRQFEKVADAGMSALGDEDIENVSF